MDVAERNLLYSEAKYVLKCEYIDTRLFGHLGSFERDD